MTQWFRVGKIVGMHGLHGELKVRPSSNNPTLLLSIEDVEIRPVRGPAFQASVKSIELEKRLLLLCLRGHDDRNSVEKLLGSEVFTPQSQLEELAQDEWWSKDLIGLDAYTTDGDHVGTICDIVGENGEFLEIHLKDRPKDATVLVPFVKPLVPTVDLERRRVEVVNLPGLLD